MTCPFSFYACKGFTDLCVSCAESQKAKRIMKAHKDTQISLKGQRTRHQALAIGQEARA